MSDRVDAFIGLGSNLEHPRQQVERAVVRLDLLADSRVTAVSALYRNPALEGADVPEQPDYVNAVACLETALRPMALLDALQGIEAWHERSRDGVQWGPRTLDLDLLLYGSSCIVDARLTVPHPGVTQRPFVIHPLAEIAPHMMLPDGSRIAERAEAVTDAGLERLGAVPGFEVVSPAPHFNAAPAAV